MHEKYIKNSINIDKSQYYKIKRYSIYYISSLAKNELRNLSIILEKEVMYFL